MNRNRGKAGRRGLALVTIGRNIKEVHRGGTNNDYEHHFIIVEKGTKWRLHP